MSILFILVLLAGVIILVTGVIKKSKALIFTGIALIVLFAILFYMLGQALSSM